MLLSMVGPDDGDEGDGERDTGPDDDDGDEKDDPGPDDPDPPDELA